MYAESREQAAVVDRLHRDDRFNLVPWFASPNAQRRSVKEIFVAKMLGLRAGVPDLMFCAASKSEEYSGLALEFKNPNGKGTISESQKEWARMLRGYDWRVEYPKTKEEAWAHICDHFGIAP